MQHADFVHLRVHSAYSLAEGAITLDELVRRCVDGAMPAVAVTDTANLFGALEFAMKASAAGVQPVIGTQLALRRQQRGNENGNGNGSPRLQAADQIVLLVQNEAGYRNLMALVSHAFLDSASDEQPQAGWDQLAQFSDGLIALTGGPKGPVGRALADGQAQEAEEALTRLAAAFPNRLYVELMRHGEPAEDAIEAELIELAYRHDLPLVATNDVYFSERAMYEAHDALLCIADSSYRSETDRRRVTPEHWFKPASAMRSLFDDLPEALDNTVVIARRCAFMPEKCKPILPHVSDAHDTDEAALLRAEAAKGLETRLATRVWHEGMDDAEREEVARPYRERLDFELGVISRMGYSGYFLIVADFIQWAKAHGIPVGPGRGSGAASVVAWSLTITDLDPLRLGLLFERFLNPERVSMPDFDIDFCQDRRDEVIRYVQERYGQSRVAQIITFGKLQARAVLRDVGRVLQMPYGQVDRICKLVPNNPANPTTLAEAVESIEQLREQRETDETVSYLIDTALKLEGLYRHASTHAAGVVIGDRPLEELVPLYRDPRSSMPVTQFNMKYVELAGLVKFDFLGLKTLTVLDRAVAMIGDSEGGPVPDLDRLPLGDEATFAMLGRGETTGVFQLESTGMRDILRRLKPTRFEEIIALVALYRPGPMDNIPTFIKVKNGEQPVEYLHEDLEPILKETFGIMIYQEQVMQVAQVLAGYSLGGADLLRRAMGKKIPAEMAAQKQVFIEGAVARGVDGERAASIFEQVAKFAGYGFNKAHAAAYAVVAYQTAYLKANHPVAFFAASMNLDMGNTDKLGVYRQELRRLEIPLLPPDVNRSAAEFSIEVTEGGQRAIRYALGALKGVGADAMRALAAERSAGGAYAGIFDLAQRLESIHVNKRHLESLIRAGAFDTLHPNRRQIFEAVDRVVRFSHAAKEERESRQVNLFGGGANSGPEHPTLPDTPDWEPLDRLAHEHDAIGFYFSAHPIDGYPVRRLSVVTHAEATRRVRPGTTETLRMAGIVMAKRERISKSDKRYAFVTLSDATASFDVTLFSEVLAIARPQLETGSAVLVTTEVQGQEDGSHRFTVTGVEPLDRAVGDTSAAYEIFVETEAAVPNLRALLDREGPGRADVSVRVRTDWEREVQIRLPQRYAVGPRGRAAIKAISGVLEVVEL